MKKRKMTGRLLAALFFVGMMVAVCAAGCSSNGGQKGSASAESTKINLDETFVSGAFGFNYPSDWEREDKEAGTYLYMPSGTGLAFFQSTDMGLDESECSDNDAKGLLDTFFEGFEKGEGIALLDKYERSRVDGHCSASAPFTIELDGEVRKGHVQCYMHDKKFDCIMIAVLEDKYDENKSLIDAVLDSVDIVSMPEDSKEEGSEATSAESMLTDAITEGKDSYSEGNYIVGKDIPAGEYRLYALSQNSSGSGYYCVYPDAARSDILENENFDNNAIITLADGQLFELSRATAIPFEQSDYSLTDSKVDGTYKVGVEMPAGTYLLEQTGSHGYWCIYDSSLPGRVIVQNNNFSNRDYVSVSDGQYLVLVGCKATKQ